MTVHQTFTGDAKGLAREIEKLQRDYIKLEESNRRLAVEALKANRESKRQMADQGGMASRMVGSLKSWAAGYLSVNAAVQLVNASLREQARLSEIAATSQINVSGGQAAVIKKLGDVSDEEANRFLANLDQIREEMRFSSVVPLQRAAAEILATGATPQETLDITRAIAAVNRDEPETMSTFGGALGDVRRSAGDITARQAAALMIGIDAEGRNVSMESMKNVAPALAAGAVVTKGADPLTTAREHAALFAGIGAVIGDVEGDITKGAVAALAVNLRDIAREEKPELKTTFERLEWIRTRPDLHEDVLKRGFRGPTVPVIEDLLADPKSKVATMTQTAFGNIQASEEALTRMEAKLENLTPELRYKISSDAMEGESEDFNRNPLLSREALARKALFSLDEKSLGIMPATGDGMFGYLGRNFAELMFNTRLQMGADPLVLAREMIEGRRREIYKDGTPWTVYTDENLPERQRARVDLINARLKTLDEFDASQQPAQHLLPAKLIEAIEGTTRAVKQAGRANQTGTAAAKVTAGRER